MPIVLEQLSSSPTFQAALARVAAVEPVLQPNGGALVPVQQAATGSVPASAASKVREVIDASIDFGVDTTMLSDSSAALQLAVNAAISQQKDLLLPKGFVCNGTIQLYGPVGIIGRRQKTQIVCNTGAFDLFRISSSDVRIENLNVNAQGKASGAEFLIDAGASALERIDIANVLTHYSRGLVRDARTTGYYTSFRMRDVQARLHMGAGLDLIAAYAFNFWERVAIDFVGSTDTNHPGFRVVSTGLAGLGAAGGYYLTECDVAGGAGTGANVSQDGYVFTDVSNVTINGSRADTIDGRGYAFIRANKVSVIGSEAGLCNGTLFEFNAVTNSGATGLRAFGANGRAGAPANVDAVLVHGASYALTIAPQIIRDATGHGINVSETLGGNLNVVGGTIGYNVGRGIHAAGNSAVFGSGISFEGNGLGNYDLAATVHNLQACQFNSGLAGNAQGPVTG